MEVNYYPRTLRYVVYGELVAWELHSAEDFLEAARLDLLNIAMPCISVRSRLHLELLATLLTRMEITHCVEIRTEKTVLPLLIWADTSKDRLENLHTFISTDYHGIEQSIRATTGFRGTGY